MRNKIKYRKGYPYPLGANKINNEIQFCVEVPEGKEITLCLYKRNHKKPDYEITATKEFMYGRIASILIEYIPLENYEYCYKLEGQNVVDSYGVKLNGIGKFGTNIDFLNVRCGFLKDFDWERVESPNLSLGEIILYRMHVRGFTRHSSSGVDYKGTFNGIKEKIPYLLDLGVNQIELMPVYEFIDTVPAKENYKAINNNILEYKCNYWGYSENNCYFSVKEAYGSSGDASTELKELIKELHRNKIEIILEFYFTYDTEVRFILDCLKFWVYEYHVDGFHLSGDIPDISIIAKEPFLVDKKIYAQYFPIDNIYGRKRNLEVNRHLIASTERYKQSMRCFLKSDMGVSEEAAYLMRKDERLTGNVNYITGHDGFTMLDMVSYEKKYNEKNDEDNLDGTDYNFSWNCGFEGSTKKKKILNLRKRQMKNAWVMLMFSKGIPAILAGDEVCNSQNGNNNAYCQDNAVGWLNWKSPKAYSGMYEFVRELINLRKEYREIWFANDCEEDCNMRKKFPLISFHGEKAWKMEFRKSSRHFGIMYYNDFDSNGNWKALYVACNMDWNPQQFALPRLAKKHDWYVAVDTSLDNVSIQNKKIDTPYVILKERSCVILTTGNG